MTRVPSLKQGGRSARTPTDGGKMEHRAVAPKFETQEGCKGSADAQASSRADTYIKTRGLAVVAFTAMPLSSAATSTGPGPSATSGRRPPSHTTHRGVERDDQRQPAGACVVAIIENRAKEASTAALTTTALTTTALTTVDRHITAS